MHTGRWSLAAVALCALAAGSASRSAAQGVTTGAISGIITDVSGAPVPSAQVQVINRSTGATNGATTRDNGQYTVVGLEVGGPYTIVVRRIGFEPGQRDGLRVTLGQTTRLDLQLRPQAVALSTVTVTAANNPVISPTKTGVSTLVSDSALRRLPTLNRNFTDFVTLVPQIRSSYRGPNSPLGISGGGVNDRYNNIQIDGASENDLFGLGATGQPGGQANSKSVAFESVKEYQVLLSPFDIRQGNFAGAQINAVTRGGTNEFHGSAYVYGYNQNLARNVDVIRSAPYTQQQYGFSLGGPILRDRLFFFVNPEWQRRSQPANGPYVGQPAGAPVPVFVSPDTITAFSNVLQNQYGIPAGSPNLFTNRNPLLNVFGRIDLVRLPFNSRLVLRENYGQGDNDIFSRSRSVNGTFNLTSNGYRFRSIKRGTVGQLYSSFANGVSNELFVGYNTIRDRRAPFSSAPQITVTTASAAGSGTATVRAGAEQFSQGNELDQTVLELTDNITIPAGAHQIVVGTKNEFFKFRNLFAQSSYGVWSFGSLANLASGTANSYTVGVVPPNGDPNARFRAVTYGFYAEDIWTVTDRFTLQYGLRVDIPTLGNRPPTNPLFLQQTGINTAVVPSGAPQWSPRVGFNWDATGDQRNQVRGGAGIFVGRPAYVWVGNVFANNGVTGGVQNLTCSGSVPRPPFNTAAITSPPTACANGLTAQAGGEIDILDKRLRLPSNARFSAGYDHRFLNGTVLSLEALYTKGLNNFFYVNRALVGPQGQDRFGRVLFGEIAPTGISQPVYGNAQRREIYLVRNASVDYAYDFTATLQRQFTRAFGGSVAYTYGRSYTAQDQTSSRAVSNFRFGRATAGNEFVPKAGRSVFDIPNRVVAQASYSFPTNTSLSFIYTGQSGNAYDYVYGGFGGRGDLNADGTQGNDLVYVPTDVNDPNQIQWATSSAVRSTATPAQKLADVQAQKSAFESYVNSEACLRESRGSILGRNSCRAPWLNNLNVSLRQSIRVPQLRGHNLSVQLDVFNFLNFLNSNWGQVKVPSFQGSQNLLTVVGSCAASAYDPVAAKCNTPASASSAFGTGAVPVVTFNTGLQRYIVLPAASYYQMQLSARYSF